MQELSIHLVFFCNKSRGTLTQFVADSSAILRAISVNVVIAL